MSSPSPSSLCSSEVELSWCRKPPNLRHGFPGISAPPPHRRIKKKTAGFSLKACFYCHGSRTMKSGPSPPQKKGTAAPVYLFFDFLRTSAPHERKSVSCHSSTDESVTSSPSSTPSSSPFSSSSSSPSSSISREENGSSKELIAEGLGTFQKEAQRLWLETAEDRNEDGDFLQRDLTSAEIYGKKDQVYDGEDLIAEEGEQQTIHSGFKMEVDEKSNDISSPSSSSSYSSFDSVIPLKEPIYEVLEVKPGGAVFTKSISRRQLLKSSGLRLRDIRSVDPSLWITNSAPALLVRDQAILLNLGSLRAIGTPENVLIFDYKSIGAAAFLEILLQRLKPESNPGVPTMPFELEVVESALLSRTQRLERRLMEIEPKVLTLLEVLPNRLTANFLEELRLSKQALVELGSKSGALRQMILELLESPQEIRRMTIMGRRCTIKKEDGTVQCEAWSDKRSADDEEEEIEMLLENYLQRCESCHGQAERLLDSAKEMEDSIAVNLSSRRLEVSRLELLLQVGTFCSALGALLAGIFGMNLKSYLETSAIAFWITTGGIIFGGIILFFIMYNHLKRRKIL